MLQLLLVQVALALTAAVGSLSPQSESQAPSPAAVDKVVGSVTGSATGSGACAPAAVPATVVGRDWTAKTEDNICGLRDLSQVSNPVVIDFQACLDATPEMKKIKSEKIDPKSPEGIRLVTEATNRVTQACEAVQRANGYCSVWKSIRHKDGRTVTDISSQVTAQF